MDTQDLFPTTHWTLILDARAGSLEQKARALESLCRAYWTPVFRFISQRAASRQDAEDLTQGFFAALLRRPFLEGAAPGQGRFRAFLLASVKNHLANEWRRSSAQKRSPGPVEPHLDATTDHEAAACGDELLYDREWAAAVVGRALNQLEVECSASGKIREFQELRASLAGGLEEPQKETAARLGRSIGATKILLHRLRRRFLELVERQVRQTVAEPGDVQDEMRHLLRCLTHEHGPR